ncbi:MAG: hypothetical protein FWE74_11190 [Oscillospiraceae bacterium]|jgi:hypothetical protein|nr:hypothetical protein [Oscillospiraceae bacterium]
MSKGLGLLILGGLAVLGGAVFAALVIKNRLLGAGSIDFDDFEDFEVVDEAEFEQFLSQKAEERAKEDAFDE